MGVSSAMRLCRLSCKSIMLSLNIRCIIDGEAEEEGEDDEVGEGEGEGDEDRRIRWHSWMHILCSRVNTYNTCMAVS